MVVGYPGQMDVFLARMLSWLSHKPLAWDVFMSVYLIAFERGLGERSALTLRLICLLEKVACYLPNLLILDTDDYVCWFGTTHGISPGWLKIGAEPSCRVERFFSPRNCKRERRRYRISGGILRHVYPQPWRTFHHRGRAPPER